MAFQWTDEMGTLSTPEFEAEARSAVAAAAEFLAAIPLEAPAKDQPRWNLGSFAAPGNKLAMEMQEKVLAGVTCTGITRHRILATAIRMGSFVRDRGGGDAGWAALGEALRKAQSTRSKMARR
jgi:hypothetical protein